MEIAVGDIVQHQGLKAQVRALSDDNGVALAQLIYFPQPGVTGPGYPWVRVDELTSWRKPERV